MQKSALPYRLNVAGVFQDSQGNVLVCERGDTPNGAPAWQIPQGGIESGESAEVAIMREMSEELGTWDFAIVRRGRETIRYDFPEALRNKSKIAEKFRGQEQIWFLLEFKPGAKPDLTKADGEFRAVAWVSVAEAVARCIEWKRAAYEKGFATLGIK